MKVVSSPSTLPRRYRHYETIELGIADKTIILNKAEATTNVVVKDGETIVIGGLIREDTTKSITGVPWLSKIPLLWPSLWQYN